MSGKNYPRLIGGMTHRGDLSWMVWAREGAGAGEVWRLDWENRPGASVVVSVMTDKGDSWFNNGNNTSGGTPATYAEIDRIGVEGVGDARQAALAYARERFGVVEVSGV
jgi:hypothetical protein